MIIIDEIKPETLHFPRRALFILWAFLAVVFILMPGTGRALTFDEIVKGQSGRVLGEVSSSSGNIWGYKVLMPGNQFGKTPPVGETVKLDNASPVTDNPFVFSGVSAGTHIVTVSIPSGWSVGYTLCYNNTSCHTDAPTPGSSATVNVPAGGYVDLWWHFSPPGIIQGYKATTSLNDPAVNSLKVSVDGSKSQTTNPFMFTGISAGAHTLAVEAPAGWSVGYTVCYNQTDCHTNTPASGSSATVNVPPGGYADLWWHFTPPAVATAKVQGYKLDNLGNPFINPGATITVGNQTFDPSTNPYIATVDAGNTTIKSSVPEGYDAYYSVCSNCFNHPASSFVKGSQVTVNVANGNYADVHWKYVKPSVVSLTLPVSPRLKQIMTGGLFTEIYQGYANIYAPEVIFENGSYKMWYGGGGADIKDRIHYAESLDGTNWTKKGAVVEAPAGSFNANDPTVVKVSGKYYMYFTVSGSDLLDSIYLTTSNDGIVWDSPVQVLSKGPYAWNARYVARPTVIYDNSVFKMWYDTTTGTNFSDSVTQINVGYATSSDGIKWQKHSVPVFQGYAALDVKKIGNTYVMLIQGAWQGTFVATSTDGITWSQPKTLIPPDAGDGANILGHITPFLLIDPATGKPKSVYMGGGTPNPDGKSGYDRNAIYIYTLKEGELEKFISSTAPKSPVEYPPATTTPITTPDLVLISPVVVEPNKTIDSLPFPSASLVNDNGTIYFISGNTKIPFTNYKAFIGLGYSLRNVVKGDLSAYTLAQNYKISTANVEHPWGSWLSYKGTIYYSHETGLIPISSWEIFLNNGGKTKYIVRANKYDVQILQANPNVPMLKNNDPRIYK